MLLPRRYSQQGAIIMTGFSIQTIWRPPALLEQEVLEFVKLDSLRFGEVVQYSR
jgi:hypothetical protein